MLIIVDNRELLISSYGVLGGYRGSLGVIGGRDEIMTQLLVYFEKVVLSKGVWGLRGS